MEKTNIDIDSLNQAYWDELAPIHRKSYDISKLFKKESLLNDIEKQELGELQNKKILHLQCHIGKESISMALEGADVTAVDYSLKSIEIAKEIALKVGVDINFVHSNIYHLSDILDSRYDIIYSSKGVLQWLDNLEKWAETISDFLSEGGFFYLQEIHPSKYILDDELNSYYFDNKQPIKLNNYDYSNNKYLPQNAAYEYRWSLKEITKSISKAGLRIEFVNEIDKLFYNGLPEMLKVDEVWWVLPEIKRKTALTFTMKAWK